MLTGSRRKGSDAQGRAAAPRPLSRGATVGSAALDRISAPTLLFVRLCDVDPRGRSRNICDGIVRLTDADPLAGTVRVSLIAAAHRFGRGHRIRLQVAGGAHPRFARNPGNGQVDAAPADLVPTRYTIGLSAGAPSVLLLAAADHATAETAGKAVIHA